MDLVLDIQSIVAFCTKRQPFAAQIEKCLEKCQNGRNRSWLYVGSLQSVLSALGQECGQNSGEKSGEKSKDAYNSAIKELEKLQEKTHFLAALAEEGGVFASPCPEGEQLALACRRFVAGSIRILTWDEEILRLFPQHAITPEKYLTQNISPQPLAFVDLVAQQDRIRSGLERRIHGVLHHGRYLGGKEVQELEVRLAEFCQAKFCISCANGTDALQIALMALGVGSGDEVVTSAFTFIATAEVIRLLGATPVYVDIDPRTYNINPSLLEAAITPKTKAIIPVSLYGQCADFDAINAIAARYNLPVIEDGAQSFGAKYKDKKSCNCTTIATTSFFPSKPLGGYGDGGAIFTNDENLALVMRQIAAHGEDSRYHHIRLGVNSRLDSLQAAVLLEKLAVLESEIALRQKVAATYSELLRQAGIVTLPYVEPHCSSVWAQYTLRLPDRERVQADLQKLQIPTAVHYPIPLNRQPAVAVDAVLPVSEKIAKEVISLPFGPYLQEKDIETVVKALAVK